MCGRFLAPPGLRGEASGGSQPGANVGAMTHVQLLRPKRVTAERGSSHEHETHERLEIPGGNSPDEIRGVDPTTLAFAGPGGDNQTPAATAARRSPR